MLTKSTPDHTVISGTEETIFGTSAFNRITIESGAKAELINFPGQNVIEIEADSSGFTVSRSGTVVIFEGSDGTSLKIPATTSVQTIAFSDRAPLTLSIYQGRVMLDDQVITAVPQTIPDQFDETITVTDLEIYDATPGNILFYFPDTGSGVNLINIKNFSKGDAIELEQGYEISHIDISQESIDILFGSFEKGWVVGFTDLEPQLMNDISISDSFGAQLQILKTYWGSNFLISQEADSCGAYVAPGVWKEFDCYNLAAIGKTTNDDPFTPSWRLIGGYWQWGRKGPDFSQWYDTNTEHFAHGPTGSGIDEANEGEIGTWDQTFAPDGTWSDSYKTPNDPCPAGFRVPTISQWEGVLDNNTQSTEGTWSTSMYDYTNYTAAWSFGDYLMLPAAGIRNYLGALGFRGEFGVYWSSSEGYDFHEAWILGFISWGAETDNDSRMNGGSIRCLAE